MSNVITCNALTKRFGSLTAIDSISFDVAQGEIFGLLGPNGAGKSTTISCLLGQLRPSGGSSALFGLDSWHERQAAHRRIGVLPSDFAFEESMTGRAVIALMSRLRGIEFPVQRAETLAERFHADLDRPQRELSRGNRQKIGLIQALAHDPDLLIMDEPTSGLDPLMQAEFLALVGELRELGRTLLLSSHDLTEVEHSCDRVAMIRRGKLFEIESVSALLARTTKSVRVRVGEPTDAARVLGALEGVGLTATNGAELQLSVAGAIDPLVKALAGMQVLDLEIGRPSLEDTFVSLYQEERA